MPGPFVLDYCLLGFLATLGVVQMAAARNGLSGLLFVRHRPASFLLGMALAVGVFLWFFLSEPRNIADTEGGLDGNQTAGYFTVSAGSAVILTLFVSSLSNRYLPRDGPFSAGLDALRETTYLRSLARALKRSGPGRPSAGR